MRREWLRWGLLGVLLVCGVFGAACTHLGYYTRTLKGGLDLLVQRRPIDAVLADPATGPELAERLRRAQRIRRFAVDELALPDDKSYTRYTDLKREAAVWTVVAAPELSVAPVEWCFLVVGCVTYRGYFSEDAAARFARRLAEEGHEVVVDGRAAYSTLGHFADPVLSTFIGYPEPRLAGLIFHELAHREVYVAGDTAFNESFATAVELAGVERWLRHREAQDGSEATGNAPTYRELQRREQQVAELYLATRDRLAAVYTAPEPDRWKRQRKAEIFDQLRQELRALGVEPAEPLNNARLVSFGEYYRWLDAFEALLARQDGDLEAFYRQVERLAELPMDARDRELRALEASQEPVSPSSPSRAASGATGSEAAVSEAAISRSLSSALRWSGSSSRDLR